MVLNPFLNLLCQRLECRNIGGHNTGVSLYREFSENGTTLMFLTLNMTCRVIKSNPSLES